jgi:hypothetical protein
MALNVGRSFRRGVILGGLVFDGLASDNQRPEFGRGGAEDESHDHDDNRRGD